MLSTFGHHGDGLPIVSDENSKKCRTSLGFEADTLAYPKLEHHRVRSHVLEQAQAFDDLPIELDKLMLR